MIERVSHDTALLSDFDLDTIDYAYCPDSEDGDAGELCMPEAPMLVCMLTASHRVMTAERDAMAARVAELEEALLYILVRIPMQLPRGAQAEWLTEYINAALAQPGSETEG